MLCRGCKCAWCQCTPFHPSKGPSPRGGNKGNAPFGITAGIAIKGSSFHMCTFIPSSHCTALAFKIHKPLMRCWQCVVLFYRRNWLWISDEYTWCSIVFIHGLLIYTVRFPCNNAFLYLKIPKELNLSPVATICSYWS